MSMLQTGATNGAISPALRRELQQELQLLLDKEKPPVTTDLQEHRVLLRLLEDARAGGATPHKGQIQRFRPGQPVDYENEGVLEQTTRKPAMPLPLRFGLMGLAVVLLFGIMALNTVLATPTQPKGPAITPSPSPSPSATAIVVAPTSTLEPLGAVRIGNNSLPPVYPNALGVGSRQWVINVAPVEKSAWKVAQEANTANWLPGSVVNWSFGLWDSADGANRALFDAIKDGTTATLWLSSGAVRRFRLGALQEVPRPQITVLGQQAPGITIVLIGGDPGADRLVLQGTEIVDTAAGASTRLEAEPQH